MVPENLVRSNAGIGTSVVLVKNVPKPLFALLEIQLSRLPLPHKVHHLECGCGASPCVFLFLLSGLLLVERSLLPHKARMAL